MRTSFRGVNKLRPAFPASGTRPVIGEPSPLKPKDPVRTPVPESDPVNPVPSGERPNPPVGSFHGRPNPWVGPGH
jgi:hypothetical protein